MDNSNSFSYLGPYLAERDYHVAAVDLLGHGHSSHVPKGYMGHFQKYVYHSKGISELLGWEKMHIIGHSMSSGVAVMFSGTFPELFEKVVLIDILGPLAFPSDRATKHLRTAILAEDKYYSKGDKPGKVYESLDAAIAARVATVSTYPGTQTLSREAAHQLLLRSINSSLDMITLSGDVLGSKKNQI
jgi:pimeloyl-ACP methyl ester carboxylesterase